ncbi:MAG: MBL fold metallo-hydrolase [Chitinophagaceae bacterium]|nr:MBL fold metallo-hydrolase [Chitinophagaceae bacterium]
MFAVKVFIFSPVQENTYVLYNEEKNCIIIDPGCYYDAEREELASFIEANGLMPQLLLNTHCHLDHVFGNRWVAKRYGLKVHLHEKEKPVLDYAPASGLMWNLPFDNYQGELIYLRENDRVKLGEDELEVFFTPGHSPGSIAFYCKKQQFVIGGDVLFRMSIGRTDLPGGDFSTLISSIRTKLLVLPDEVTVYPGHGEPTTIGFERTNNPFLV